jgi:S1-C subfamily serine protease
VLNVRTVLRRSPAMDAGLLAGDQIYTVDGKAVECDDLFKGQTEQFVAYIGRLSPGTVVNLRVLRGSEAPRQVEVKLAAWPNPPPLQPPCCDDR